MNCSNSNNQDDTHRQLINHLLQQSVIGKVLVAKWLLSLAEAQCLPYDKGARREENVIWPAQMALSSTQLLGLGLASQMCFWWCW